MNSEEQAASKQFVVYVPYILLSEDGDHAYSSVNVTISVNESNDGYIPERLTPEMLSQIRAHIAVDEKCDEEWVWISNVVLLEPGHISESAQDGV